MILLTVESCNQNGYPIHEADLADRGKEQRVVTIRLIDMLAPVTARGDVRESHINQMRQN